MEVQKILVIRFSSIGDIVLCSPVIRCLHQQLNAEIHVLTKARFTSISESNPYVKKVWTLEEVQQNPQGLRQANFQFIVDLHANIRSKKIQSLLKLPTYTLDKINVPKWLKVNLGLDVLPAKHIVDRMFEAIESLGVQNDGTGLDFFFTQQEALEKKYPKRGSRIGVVLGGAHATKQIPNSLLERILQGLNAEVLLLGGPSEYVAAEHLAKKLSAVNCCGETNLEGSAQLIETCDLVITSDTGLMHMAAALGKDIIVLWGSTIPEFGMYPYLVDGKGSVEHFEVKDLGCRPCSKIGFEACPWGHFNCMMKQDVDSIRFCIRKRLESLESA